MATPALSLLPTNSLPVFPAEAFRVCCGANEGDGLSFADDLMLDDVYVLAKHSRNTSLSLVGRNGDYVVEKDSEVGMPGARIHPDCTVTLMDCSTKVTEILVLVELSAQSHAQQIHLLPLAPLIPGQEYRLVGIDTKFAEKKLAQLACVSFAEGTQITLGSGRQCKVQDLRPGDAILTRDEGVQHLRWIGHTTQRAVGAFAPIRIKAGTLNNLNDLLVSPDHRLFVYQRSDHFGVGRAEMMVKARHLVNGSSVVRQEGGFVDYFQLLFDQHHIVFAEGIAAEAMRMDETTAPLLDASMLHSLEIARTAQSELDAHEVNKAFLNRPDAVDMLRRASGG
ncbi:MAG: Hint domain-containing protein [Roseobacter sp.]|jgi:hypothetical protein|nr:Hint domain-containing protein [Roseobacter sp.]